jgi:nitroreductase
MVTFERDQVDQLLTTTLSVRRRLDLSRPVEPHVITECLRLATHAPNASNTQLWRWIVVTDAEKRSQIAAHYREAFDRYARPGASGPPSENAPDHDQTADPSMERVFRSAQHLAENLHRVPVHIIPCYLEQPNLEAGNVALATMYGSIVQAVWSLQLALRSRGLGSAWTTLHLWHEREIASLLGIPDGVTQIALLPVAYTLGTAFRPASRRPVEEVTHWNEWSE